MSNPIRIKGVLYDSLSAACRAYGVMLQTVLLRIKRGETVDQAFTGRDRRIGSLSLRKYGPFEIDGQTYNGLVDLAYATTWNRAQFTADTAPDCGAVTWYGRPGGKNKNENNFY